MKTKRVVAGMALAPGDEIITALLPAPAELYAYLYKERTCPPGPGPHLLAGPGTITESSFKVLLVVAWVAVAAGDGPEDDPWVSSSIEPYVADPQSGCPVSAYHGIYPYRFVTLAQGTPLVTEAMIQDARKIQTRTIEFEEREAAAEAARKARKKK